MGDGLRASNPFARRDSHGRKTLIAYRTLSSLSWLAVVVCGAYYSRPRGPYSPILAGQAHHNPTLFSHDTIVAFIYWVILLVAQLGYIAQLWSSNAEKRLAASKVAPYFILNNVLVLAFIRFWLSSLLWEAEIVDVVNIISQSFLYWQHPGLPTSIHLPAVAGPYAWTISAFFWTGAIALPERPGNTVVANVLIWVYLLIGQGHIIHRRDHQFGYAFSLLSLSLALKQLSLKISSLQWIFAFVVFGLLLASSINSSGTRYLNYSFFHRKRAEAEIPDREREPLLSGNEHEADHPRES